MRTKFKIGISIIVLVISSSSMFIAWAPLLVTYVPLDQSEAHNISSNMARVFEEIIHHRDSLQSEGLITSSILIIVNTLITLTLILRFKKN